MNNPPHEDSTETGMETVSARELAGRLAGVRVLVLGDLCLDEYLEGRTERLSREAPVPVVEVARRTGIPGGAANPARNVVALGGEALLAGVVGTDRDGQALLALLQEGGVDTSGVVIDPCRETTVKTRVIAYRDSQQFPQHIARVDRTDRAPVEGDALERLLDRIEVLAPRVDAVLVSDYRSGVLAPDVIREVASAARSASVLTTVDTQGNLAQYGGFGLIKCNRGEAEAELGQTLAVDADYERALARLLPRLGAQMLVITRGPEGMSIQARGHHAEHLAAANRSEVFDVTGAGDTVIAVLTMGLVAGMSLRSAAHLANLAAGIVVRRLGNVAVTQADLEAEFEP